MDAPPTTPGLQQDEDKNTSTPTAPAPVSLLSVKKEPTSTKPTVADLGQLTKLYELGLIDKSKVQQIILQMCPDPVVPGRAPDQIHDVSAPRKRKASTTTSPPSKPPSKHSNSKNTPVPDKQTSTPPPNKKARARSGRSSPNTSMLRKLAKDPTRRRFFEQCLKLDSILWRKLGGTKVQIDNLLFIRAAKDPIDELYATHPGLLHSTEKSKVESVVKWQVYLYLARYTNFVH